MKQTKEIKIKVDTNDADYMMEINKISEKDLKKIKPLLEAIKNFKPYKGVSPDGSIWSHGCNYPYGDCLRGGMGEKSPEELYPEIDKEVYEIFEDLCPYAEYGFHTVVSVEVYEMQLLEKLI